MTKQRGVSKTTTSEKKEKAIQMMSQGKYKDYEVAEACHISARSLSRWKNEDEEFRQALKDACFFNVFEAVPYALRRMRSLLNSKNEMVAYMAAKDILDRAGLTEKNASIVSVNENERVVIINDTRKAD